MSTQHSITSENICIKKGSGSQQANIELDDQHRTKIQ
jgi:hypothetical protein